MDIIQPIQMQDTTSGKTLSPVCTALLRRIPGRRSVYEGQLDGKAVIIKCFNAGLQGRRHYHREIHGFKELTLRGLKTAEVAAAGMTDHNEHVVVLIKIDDARDVFSVVTSPGEPNCRAVLMCVFECVACMHAAGVRQPDLHLGNFLWTGRTVYVLDPGEMKFTEKPLDKAASFQQLAVLLASLPETAWPDKTALLEHYFQTRGWSFDSTAAAAIDERIEIQRVSRIDPILRKTLRTSKRYICLAQHAYRGVFARSLVDDGDLLRFVSTIDDTMASGSLLKRGNTCVVSRIHLNGRDVVVKRYNHKGPVHSIRHTLKGSRAKKCWLFGHRLNQLGIATAEPLAFFERRRFGLVWQSYILNAFIEGVDIQTYLNDPGRSETDQQAMSANIRALLDRLVRFKITHGDLKAGNILIQQDRPVLIDLDSMKRHRCRRLLQFYARKMNDTLNKRNILWKQ